MSIPTSRTEEAAVVTIDQEKCNGCGKCITACSDFEFKLVNGKATLSESPVFGCIACGHCMAVCPEGAIEANGRCLTPGDMFTFTGTHTKSDYTSLLQLFQSRRSIRKFKDKPVTKQTIDSIIEAAQTAPMGVPPSDVNLLVLDNKEKVRQFSSDFCTFLDKNRWFVSGWFMTLMTPFYDRKTIRFFKKFMRPLFDAYINPMKEGVDQVTYDAPAAIYFYGSPYCDPADPIIAATYAMIAAESLGLGTCMIGGVHPFVQFGTGSKEFRNKYGIRFKSREGLILIFGYPKINYTKGIRRTFANVDFL
jgi:nitroreductase